MTMQVSTNRLRNRIAANADRTRKVLLILIALICLFAAVLNLTGLYNTDLNYLYFSNEGEIHFTSVFANMKQLYDTNFLKRNDFSGLETVNDLYCVANIALAVLAVAMIFFIEKSEKKQKPCKIVSAVGLGVSAAYMIAFVVWGISTITFGPDSIPYGALVSSSQYGSTQIIFAGVPLVTWILAALYLLLLALGKFEKIPQADMEDKSMTTLSANHKWILRGILLALIVVCVITSVLNICGTYEVTTHHITKIPGRDTYRSSNTRHIDDLYIHKSYNNLEILNVIYGAGNAVLVVLAVFFLLKSFKNDHYKALKLYTLLSLGIHVLYICLFNAIGSVSVLGLGGGLMSFVDVHFITWINLALSALLVVVPLIKINSPKTPAVEAAESTAE